MVGAGFKPAPTFFTDEKIGIEAPVGRLSVCHKFFPLGGFQIPLNPPFSKGNFSSNSL
jgi:hypothetical protein